MHIKTAWNETINSWDEIWFLVKGELSVQRVGPNTPRKYISIFLSWWSIKKLLFLLGCTGLHQLPHVLCSRFNMVAGWLSTRSSCLTAWWAPTLSGFSLRRTAASVQHRDIIILYISHWINLDQTLVLMFLSFNRFSDRWVKCFAYFDNVGSHGLQWDEPGLLHVDLLLIGNYPWKILSMEMWHNTFRKFHTYHMKCRVSVVPDQEVIWRFIVFIKPTLMTWTFSMLRVAASRVCTRTVNEHPVVKIEITKKPIICKNSTPKEEFKIKT